MKTISLVCSVHQEQGPVNVPALCAILDRIRPDVVFLEIPPEPYADFVETERRSNLESTAVGTFRKVNQVDLVPVDLPTPNSDFFRRSEHFFREIERSSSAYRGLVDVNRRYVRDHGFDYLNSEYCSSLWSDIYREIRCAAVNTGDASMIDFCNEWTQTMKLRDIAMVQNIRAYSLRNDFKNAVFLVGASHRASIINEANKQFESDSATVRWEVGCWIARKEQGGVQQ